MLAVKKTHLSQKASVTSGIIWLLLVATLASVSQGNVPDRRFTVLDANRLADTARKNSDFPITINGAVVQELNRYIGTAGGRTFIKNALLRMGNYHTLIESKLASYQLPRELMAMPITESGYENLPQGLTSHYSAGVWQFVPQTARDFGLTVDDSVDDRLDVEKETDAACRYLGALFLRFQDWELSVLAYNAGEGKIQNGIDTTGSRSAWKLIDAGFSGDSGYLPKMIAAILIMDSPSIVE